MKCLKSRKDEIKKTLLAEIVDISSAQLQDFDWQIKVRIYLIMSIFFIWRRLKDPSHTKLLRERLFGGEWIHVYVWPSPFAVQLKLSQHCNQLTSSAGKESACNAGDPGSIPGLGRSPGEGSGYPLQYSGLENSMDCIVHGFAKSQTLLSNFHFLFINLTKYRTYMLKTIKWFLTKSKI